MRIPFNKPFIAGNEPDYIAQTVTDAAGGNQTAVEKRRDFLVPDVAGIVTSSRNDNDEGFMARP